MEVKKIDISTSTQKEFTHRPNLLDDFVGQEEIKKVLKSALFSAQKRSETVGHTLLSGPSGFGKTTLAHIIAQHMNVRIKVITGYAITKPSELISILNSLEIGDVLFIDEIHRLKPNLEEMLYIGMEDFCIDMVLPEGGNVRLPINPFTLVGATTKMESLSAPFKNRFVYKFHFMEYSEQEKSFLVERYLRLYSIKTQSNIIDLVVKNVDTVPREIHNFCITIRDFLIAHGQDHNDLSLTIDQRNKFEKRSIIEEGGLTPLHKKYLTILENEERAIGVKTIAIKMGIHEKSIENDVEPLLLKLGKIEKTTKGRIKVENNK